MCILKCGHRRRRTGDFTITLKLIFDIGKSSMEYFAAMNHSMVVSPLDINQRGWSAIFRTHMEQRLAIFSSISHNHIRLCFLTHSFHMSYCIVRHSHHLSPPVRLECDGGRSEMTLATSIPLLTDMYQFSIPLSRHYIVSVYWEQLHGYKLQTIFLTLKARVYSLIGPLLTSDLLLLLVLLSL